MTDGAEPLGCQQSSVYTLVRWPDRSMVDRVHHSQLISNLNRYRAL